MADDHMLLKGIKKKLDEISINLEKFKIIDYVYFLENPRKMLWANFIGGVARGFGIAVGFSILGALMIYILKLVVQWKLPLIGEFISEIVNIVQDNLVRTKGTIN